MDKIITLLLIEQVSNCQNSQSPLNIFFCVIWLQISLNEVYLFILKFLKTCDSCSLYLNFWQSKYFTFSRKISKKILQGKLKLAVDRWLNLSLYLSNHSGFAKNFGSKDLIYLQQNSTKNRQQKFQCDLIKRTYIILSYQKIIIIMNQSNLLSSSFFIPMEKLSDFSFIKFSQNNDENISEMGSTQMNISKPKNQEDYRFNIWLQSQDSILNNIQGLSQVYPQEKQSEPSIPSKPIEDQEKKKRKKINNETKNIPKNFGKAIVNFIYKHQDKLRKLIKADQASFKDFLGELDKIKKEINNIDQLREMWTTFKYAKWMRQLSNLFFRKHGLHYIYNSRISSTSIHVKYRNKLLNSLADPAHLKYLKEY